MEGNENKSTSLFSGSDKNYSLVQFNFGVGLEINLINNLNLVVDGKMINGFGGPLYFPIMASIKFGL